MALASCGARSGPHGLSYLDDEQEDGPEQVCEGQAAMTMRLRPEDCDRGINLAVCRRPERRSFAGRIGSWLAAIAVALALLWCDGALAAGPHVIMLRGLFGVFSTGLDSIADQLKAKGIKAEVAGHLHWTAAVAEIVRERSAGQTGPVILVGHSQGANNVIDMARSLKSHNITVDLLVTLAPSSANSIPANVSRAINYYQAGGWGDAIVPDHGFHGAITNVNLASDETITHVNIDKNPKVESEIVRQIVAVAR